MNSTLTKEHSAPMRILSADDDLTSRMLLKANLSRWGYDVVSAADGTEAMERLQEDPTLRFAILDWMMPGLDGVDICRKLRDNELNRFVYTILLTSKSNKADLVEGLSSGAHDFLTKPFHPSELRSRLEVGIRILAYETQLASANNKLKTYADEMEHLADDRAKQLLHSERLATLGTMSAGIAHEINNPTSFISGNIQTLKRFWQVLDTLVDGVSLPEEMATRLSFIREETPNVIQGMQEGVSRISRIVKGLKSFSARDTGEQVPVDINETLENALLLATNTLKAQVTVDKKLAPDLPRIQGCSQELEQVFINLFVNAAHAIEPKGKGTLSIRTMQVDEQLQILIEDTGSGIPEELMVKIWDPFFTTKGVGKGTGLGLAISLGIIERHQGQIWVENRPEGGARFLICLPVLEGVVKA